MIVGVVGLGHVGRHTAELLGEAVVLKYDIAIHAALPEEFELCDVYIVCVGTPEGVEGAQDLSQVESALRSLPLGARVIMRSSVLPGTCQQFSSALSLDVAMWPEFLGEENYYYSQFTSLAASPFHILGGPDSPWLDDFADLLSARSGASCRVIRVATAEAEFIKYMENSYFATKLAFVHEFRMMCESLGLDWHRVREGWLLDPRVERDHTGAFHRDFAYGGRCLPKDVHAALALTEKLMVDAPLLRAVAGWSEVSVRLRR